MTSPATAPELARTVADVVDRAASRRVLVLGSLPPHGRDLDLLVRAPEREQVERALRASGLVQKGNEFALFRDCSAYGVELIDAEGFVPSAALEQLFEDAVALEGASALARPSAAHALLVLARLARDEGGLRPKRRARLARILSENTLAFEHAQRAAPTWRAERDLSRLQKAADAREGVDDAYALSPALQAERLARRIRGGARAFGRTPRVHPRGGLLVALSGIDGAGKSSQARWLADSLTALGADVQVVWNDLLGNRALKLLSTLSKAALRLAGRGRDRERMARWDAAPPGGSDADAANGRTGASATRAAWSIIVTVANALEQQLAAAPVLARGRVVVFDRSPLDLAVRMQILYRAQVEWQRRLVRFASPGPDLAFLLDIPPEVSLARKQDVWSPAQLEEQAMLYRTLAARFGVHKLDGQRPPAEIAAEIASRAWLALR